MTVRATCAGRVVLSRLGLLSVAAAAVLSGCGSHGAGSGMDHGSGMTTPTATADAGAVFDDADVMFAQMMIEHHRQAVAMADLAGTRAAGSDLKALASKIRQAQQPEIDTMTGWLTAWGRPVPAMSAGTDMHHGSMPGVMTDEDMTELAAATGPAFDKRFLAMMIDHHQGAITMAQEETANGSNPDAKALAAKIVTDQQAEITQMRTLLARL